ncbi:MAG TPA: DinB family protein [Flavisolibacter sp.]|jgi:uncharacterized damage-inducible protein DinB|nr:DinB family protein [Flavisolibacter sp.]
MRKIHHLLLLALGCCFMSTAFATNNDSLKAQFIKDWQRAKEYTRAYLEKMPADKYGYRPVDSIRSFSEQMLHLAQGSVFLAGNGTGNMPPALMRRNLEKTASAQSKDSVTYFVMASYDYVIDGIKNMPASALEEYAASGKLRETKATWISKAFEHQTHHRGQCTIYIRLQGIVPPGEMLF